jgi:hypothetical protein
MMRTIIFIFIFIILCGTITNLCGGCKKQETAKLTIVIEGRELSDAEVIIDGKRAGRLTQTIIKADGKIFINGTLAAKMPNQNYVREGDEYSGCSDTLDLTSGGHTITLQKKEIHPLQVVVNISPGHHLLTFLPEKDLLNWDNMSSQVGPGRTVTITSEKTKKQNN